MAMRFSVCNEMFGEMEFAKAADLAADHGFDGLEIAAYSVFGDFSRSAVEAGVKTIKKGLAGAGLDFAGLHWLFVRPEGLHVTSRDPDVRYRSWEHLDLMIDAAGELGGGDLIFGSPRQRSARGIPRDEAKRYFLDGLRDAGQYAARQSCRVILEPLPSMDTDILNTLDETRRVLRYLHSPGLAAMFAFHNTADETETWERLIERNADIIRHVHLNSKSGGWPNAESREYFQSFAMLKKIGYGGWVSLEIFSIPDDPVKVLVDTRAFFDIAVKS